MPGISIEAVDLNVDRQCKHTHCTPVTPVTFNENVRRRVFRLALATGDPAYAGSAEARIAVTDPVLTTAVMAVLMVNRNCPQAELDFYQHGDVVQGSFQVVVSGVGDALVTEVIRSAAAREKGDNG